MRRVRSDYCVHMTVCPETRYEPAEYYCSYGEEEGYDCDNCPHRMSKEDVDSIRADFEYDRYQDQLNFGI